MPAMPPAPESPSSSESAPSLQELLIHAPFVRAVARAAVRGDHQVDDVVQATWLAAVERGPRHGGSVKGWLATVTRNAARALGRGEGRRTARERRAARPEALDSTAEIVAQEEIRTQLIRAVLGLPQPYRSAILLRYYEQLSPRAVAARLDLPLETARTHIKRGLKLLRERLDEQHGGERRAWAVAASGLMGGVGAGGVAAGGVGVLLGTGVGKLAAAAAVLLVGVLAYSRLSEEGPQPGAMQEPESSVVPAPGLALADRPKRRAGSGVIAGVVRLPEGAQGARVDVYWMMSMADLRGRTSMMDIHSPLPGQDPVGRLEVGPDGAFRLEGLAGGIYQVWAVSETGFVDARSAIIEESVLSQPVRPDLVPGPHRLQGRVVQADGTPLRGVVSILTGQSMLAVFGVPEGPAPQETDAEGGFSFEGLRAGRADVLFVQPGARSVRQPLQIPHEGPLEMILGAGAHVLRGEVVNEVDGAPVPWALITTVSETAGHSAMHLVRGDVAGRFEVALSGERVALIARAPGFAYESVKTRELSKPLTIALAPLARIQVIVVAAEDGTPLEGVTVYAGALRRRGGPALGAGVAPTTGKDGRVTLETEPGEAMVAAFGARWTSSGLSAVSETFNPLVVSTVSGETSEVRLEVVPAAHVSGVVRTTAGEPVADAVVTVRRSRNGPGGPGVRIPPAHTRTDQGGAYVLETVLPGRALRVRVASRTHGVRESEPFTLAAGERRRVDLKLSTARYLDVRVVDQDGEPMASVQVSVYRQRSSGGFEGRAGGVSSEDGTLRLGPLGPEDTHYRLRGEGFVEVRESRPFPDVTLGRTVDLVVERGATILGRVVVPAGMGAEGLPVVLRSDGRGSATHARGATGVGGSFRFEGLPAGTYTLSVRGRWRNAVWKAKASIASGTSDAVLSLAEIASKETVAKTRDGWELRLLAPDGSPVHACWVWRYGEYEWQQGRGAIENLGGGGPTEAPRFVASDPRVSRMWIEVLHFEDPGKKRRPHAPQLLGPFGKDDASGAIEVRLRDGQTIQGRVLGADGRGIRGITLSAYAKYPIGVTSSESHGSARTGTDGSFELTGLGDFSYELRLAVGENLAPVLPVVARAGATDVVVHVQPGTTVTLSVVDHAGRPVARAPVSVQLCEDLQSGAATPRRTRRSTDSEGRVRLAGLDPVASYELKVQVPAGVHEALGYEAKEWTPADGTITLPRGYIISGHVRTSAGAPVEGAAVYRQISPNGYTTAITAADGAFRFNNLGGESQTLVATSGVRFQPHEKGALRRSVVPGSRAVVFTLDPLPSIEIVYPDASDEDLRAGVIRVRLTEATSTAATPSPASATAPRPIQEVYQGKKRYTLRGVDPDTTYTVWVVGGGGVFLQRGVRAGDSVNVKPIKGHAMRIRLRLPGGLPDGMAWHNAAVVASGPGWQCWGRLVDPKTGVFEVSGLPESALLLKASLERWNVDPSGGPSARIGSRWSGVGRVAVRAEVELDLTEE